MDVTRLLLAQDASEPVIDPAAAISDALEDAPDTPEEALAVMREQVADLWTGLLQSLPIVLIGLVIFLIALIVALLLARAARRGIERSGADPVATSLLSRMVRTFLILIAAVFALSVMGISVSNVLTVLAVLGFAVGLAIQGILQNFVAGVILLLRKPFRAGDQIITGDFEGTVVDIDFRVTRLVSYDGTKQLIPNSQVYDNPLVNLTSEGSRRSSLGVGVDYRDDHHAARGVIRTAVEATEGVLEQPAVEVLLTELGDSSVNYEIRYWTTPDIRSVRHVQDRVLGNVKSAIEDAGMTIPWPIRTLVVDGDVPVVSARGPERQPSG